MKLYFSKRVTFYALIVLSSLGLLGIGSYPLSVDADAGSRFLTTNGFQYQNSTLAGSFKIATYNIQRGKGKDDVRDLKRIGEAVRGAHIIGLQEVSGTLFYGWHDQVQQLAQQLKMSWLFAPTVNRWFQSYYANGILSNFEVKHWTQEPLPSDRSLQRAFRNLVTVVVPINGRDVTILVTHLDRGEIRQAQLEFVLDRFKQISGPAILMGDLNVDESEVLLQQLFETGEHQDAIFQAIGDFWRLDWIITRGFEVLEGGYTPRGISDHAHYWVELKFDSTKD